MEGNRYDNNTLGNNETTTSGEWKDSPTNNLENTGNANMSIGCNVHECKYHAQNQEYCTLNHINVVKNNDATMSAVEYTDCGSYVYKQ